MIVLLIGAPGAGKGTQADLLASKVGYRKISTGDALRKHVKLGTPIGKQAEAIMARGELVPDDVLLKILKEELGSDSKETVILDGYPRNVTQAATLMTVVEKTHPVKGCIHLDVSREELISRLSGRRVCSSCGTSFHIETSPPHLANVCDKCGGQLIQRPDDEPKSIAVRLDVYDKNTQPVLDYFKERDLYCRVNGSGVPSEIFDELQDAIGTCVT